MFNTLLWVVKMPAGCTPAQCDGVKQQTFAEGAHCSAVTGCFGFSWATESCCNAAATGL